MAALTVEIPPVAEPVTLATVKSHLRVTLSDDDALIGMYLQAAREDVENFLGRSLVNKGYRQSLDCFPYFDDSAVSQQAYPPSYYSLPRYSTTQWNYSQMIKLLRCPLVKVSRITYIGADQPVPLPHDLFPAPQPWAANAIYALGDQVTDGVNLEEVTAVNESETGGASTSGATRPTWNATLNATTADHDLTWTNKGAAPAGDFVYDADSEPPRLFPVPGGYWPGAFYVPNAVQIHYVAGYGPDDKNVPALPKVGILQTVASWYENRESVSPETLKEVPGHVQQFLWNMRVMDYSPTRG